MLFDVVSGTTPQFTANLVDQDDNPVSTANLTTLKITVFDVKTRAVINSRDRQNAKNANNVTYDDGALVWDIQPADLPATDETQYLCVFEWTWDSGARAGSSHFTLRVSPVPRP